jgi:hypothetical protein
MPKLSRENNYRFLGKWAFSEDKISSIEVLLIKMENR